MAGDEYASVSGGALRLKGSRVTKHKKKKRKDATNELEKAASNNDQSDEPLKSSKKKRAKDDDDEREASDDNAPHMSHKTEAQKRFEEAKKKKLMEMAESAEARPDLLKTHKERVEELNTYLSKLSEHHDMPKIGPG